MSVLDIRISRNICRETVPLNKKVIKEVIMKHDHASYFDANIQIKNISIDYQFEIFRVPDVTSTFLLSQHLLTTLKITALNLGLTRNKIFNQDFSGKIKFRLKTLELSYECPERLTDIKLNISKFLKTQQELQSLKLNGHLSQEIWEVVVKLPKLEKLELSHTCFIGFDLFGKIEQNKKIIELALFGGFCDDIFKKVLISFPRVTKFVQKGKFITTDDHLKSLVELLPFLRTMQVRMFESEVEFKDHVFNNLKNLRIDALRMYRGFPDHRINFVKMFPAVERLSLMQGVPKYTIPSEVTDAIFEGLKDLQIFEVGPSFMNKYVVQYIR